MSDDSKKVKSSYEEMGRPDQEVTEAKAQLVRQLNAAIESRGLTIPEVGRVVGVTVDEVARVLRGVMRSYSVSRLGSWLDWLVSGRGYTYPDDSANYGEDFSSSAERRLHEATGRVGHVFGRLRLGARGRVHPLRYEAMLSRLENIAIELSGAGNSAADFAERRLDEFEDDLSILLVAATPLESAPAMGEHAYREDSEGYGEYGLGAEDRLRDTSKRLERLQRRLRRDLRGRLPAEEYEALSGRVVRATIEYRGDILEASAAAERKVIGLRNEIAARVAELDAAEDAVWQKRVADGSKE